MRPVAMPDFVAMSGVFIERRPIIGVAAVEEPPGDGAGYMDDLDTIRRCSSGSQWEYLAGIGKFMAEQRARYDAAEGFCTILTPKADPAKY